MNKTEHGFKKNKSTTTAMMDIIKYIIPAFKERYEVELAYLNLSKAFIRSR